MHLLFQEVDRFSWITITTTATATTTIIIIIFKAFNDLFQRKYFKSLFYNSKPQKISQHSSYLMIC